jgi:hypothetical protein
MSPRPPGDDDAARPGLRPREESLEQPDGRTAMPERSLPRVSNPGKNGPEWPQDPGRRDDRPTARALKTYAIAPDPLRPAQPIA